MSEFGSDGYYPPEPNFIQVDAIHLNQIWFRWMLSNWTKLQISSRRNVETNTL